MAFLEKLTAEELARARAEEEVQHLRACIEERDGHDEVSNSDNISITESDSEEEQEPTFKKGDINRTRLLRQSLVIDVDNGTEYVSDLDDTLKDDSDKSSDNIKKIYLMIWKMKNAIWTLSVLNRVTKALSFLMKIMMRTFSVTMMLMMYRKSSLSISLAKTVTDIKNTFRNDSLAQFEQFEMESNNCNPAESLSLNEFGKNLPSNTKGFFYDSEKNSELVITNIDDERSPSIVQDDENDNYEPSMIKKLLKKNFVALHENLEHLNVDQDTLKGNKETDFKESFDCVILEHTFEASQESVDLFESPRPGNTELFSAISITSLEIILNSRYKTIPSFPSLEKDNINEKSETDNIIVENIRKLGIVDVSHIEEETANDSKKETIVIEIDEKESKIRQSLSPLIKTSREIETTTKPNILEDEIKTESHISIDDASLNVKHSLPKPCDLFKVPLPLNENTKLEKVKHSKNTNDVNEKTSNDISIANVTINNTLDAFEDIYKNITLPRVTEFDLLVSTIEEKAPPPPEAKTKYNLRQKSIKTRAQHTKEEIVQLGNNTNDQEEVKKFDGYDEILIETQAKCESKPKRNLRLHRRKDGELKFKDMANLQAEFSDVTMNLPAPTKLVEDIPSPVKDDEEDISPILGIQSCPSKSVTRSRRKLFTPRAEALEETCPQTVDGGEQIRVPRPSYHRPRARRKL
ncbi:uncharacterized protein LOC125056285 [Pieris napi]|uniref:uncharacterized protein LOC125056285 n=1 Tax=Pieris napi TaxID=78633 RepID=UPI001FBBE602|nr:uncharacterized protein LOC125056285 [Pieris napi]